MVKNNFQTLADNRLDITKRLAMDDELAKCLLNKSENFKDTTVTPIEKARLMYSQIFPFSKTTNTLDNTKSYITMRFKYRKTKGSNKFKTSGITLFVFCHENMVTTPYGIIRPDYLVQQVDRLLNDTNGDGWLGRLSLDGMDDVIFDNGYIGLSVTYTSVEFQ